MVIFPVESTCGLRVLSSSGCESAKDVLRDNICVIACDKRCILHGAVQQLLHMFIPRAPNRNGLLTTI